MAAQRGILEEVLIPLLRQREDTIDVESILDALIPLLAQKGWLRKILIPLLKQFAMADRLLAQSNHHSQLHPLLFKIKIEVQEMETLWDRRQAKDIFAPFSRLVDNLVRSNDPREEEDVTDLSPQIQELESIYQEIAKLRAKLRVFCEADGKLTSSSEQSSSELREEEINWEKIFKESAALSHLSSRIENLDGRLKRCLFSFTAFPENTVIKTRLLVHWWIGEGLVVPSNGKSAEENGKNCIHDLVSKCLVEPIYSKPWSLKVDSCKMYPWIYRLPMFSPPINDFFSPSARECLVQTGRLASSEADQDQLKSLYNISNQYLKFEKEWFARKKNLGLMQLGRWQDLPKHHIEVVSTDFLQELRKCNKLKYLSLRGISRIAELPHSISKLTHIIILDLRACHNLEELPVSITSLKNLTHLDVSECYLLEQMPKGIGNLSKLQLLKGFVIGNARSGKRRSTDPCSLTELSKLRNLKKLGISIGRNSVVLGNESHALENLSALTSLTIRWGVVVSGKGNASADASGIRLQRMKTMLGKDPLSLPSQLEKLDLRCFPGKDLIDYVSVEKLTGLRKLYIRGGELHSLQDGITGMVEVLRLKFLENFVFSWSLLQHENLKLAYLEVCRCPRLMVFPSQWEDCWTKKASFEVLGGIWTLKGSPYDDRSL